MEGFLLYRIVIAFLFACIVLLPYTFTMHTFLDKYDNSDSLKDDIYNGLFIPLMLLIVFGTIYIGNGMGNIMLHGYRNFFHATYVYGESIIAIILICAFFAFICALFDLPEEIFGFFVTVTTCIVVTYTLSILFPDITQKIIDVFQ